MSDLGRFACVARDRREDWLNEDEEGLASLAALLAAAEPIMTKDAGGRMAK